MMKMMKVRDWKVRFFELNKKDEEKIYEYLINAIDKNNS